MVIVDLAAPDTAGAPEPATILQAAKVLNEQACVQSCETIEHTLRLYVDSGATAIPQIMRALSNAGIEPGAIETRCGRVSTTCSWPRRAGLLLTDCQRAGRKGRNEARP